jgi:hypothetical protein
MTRLAALSIAAASGVVLAVLLPSGTAAAIPTIGYTCSPGPSGCEGWSSRSVTLKWIVTGEESTLGCDTVTFAQDGVHSRTCTASAGEFTLSRTATVRIDTTPPVALQAKPSRNPDAGDWYVRPVDVAFAGSDSASGIASCTVTTYSGPDSPAAPVTGTCVDVAGNVSAPLTYVLRFDATPPSLAGLVAEAGDRSVHLRWAASPDVALIEVVRSPGAGGPQESVVFRGTGSSYVDRSVSNGVTYAYRVVGLDAAGNAASATAGITPGRRLIEPVRLAGVAAAASPVLRWTAVVGARYYNVQLYRSGRKILSAWPSAPRLALRRTWTYRGRRYRLVPGRYRWFVWPGFGPRRAHRFGRVIGPGTFVIRPGEISSTGKGREAARAPG